MNHLFLASLSNFFAGFGVLGVFLTFVIFLLYALFPLIVMAQLSRIATLKRDLAAALEQISVGNKQQSLILSELQKQNSLSRQSLRASGHEPEV